MSRPSVSPLVVNGWMLFAHPLFLDQVEALIEQVETRRQKDPAGYVKMNASKRLAAIISQRRHRTLRRAPEPARCQPPRNWRCAR